MEWHVRKKTKPVPATEDPEGPAIGGPIERGTGAAIARVPMPSVEDVDEDVLMGGAFKVAAVGFGNIGAAGTRSPSDERSTLPCAQSARIILSLL